LNNHYGSHSVVLLRNEVHLLCSPQNSFILTQIVPLNVCSMFRPVQAQLDSKWTCVVFD